MIHWKGYNAEDNSWELGSVIFEDTPLVVTKFHDNHPGAIWHVSTSQITLPVQKLSDNAQLPTSGLELATGKDLYSAAFIEIPSKSRSLIPTDIAIAIPEGHYACIVRFLDWAVVVAVSLCELVRVQ